MINHNRTNDPIRQGRHQHQPHRHQDHHRPEVSRPDPQVNPGQYNPYPPNPMVQIMRSFFKMLASIFSPPQQQPQPYPVYSQPQPQPYFRAEPTPVPQPYQFFPFDIGNPLAGQTGVQPPSFGTAGGSWAAARSFAQG